jgi:hypothetical protein
VRSEAGDSVEVATPVDLPLPCSSPLHPRLNTFTSIRKVSKSTYIINCVRIERVIVFKMIYIR